MPKTLITSRLQSNKHKAKTEQKLNNTKPVLPPNLPPFKQKLLSRTASVDYK